MNKLACSRFVVLFLGLTVVNHATDASAVPDDTRKPNGKTEAGATGASDLDEQIAVLTEQIKLHPANAQAYTDRGAAYIAKGEFDKAIADFTEAIRHAPETAEAYFDRGYIYLRRGQCEEAVADYTEVIRLDPSIAMAYNNRGFAYDEQGEYEKAVADYAQAIKLDAELSQAYSNRGALYANQGEYDKSVADYTEVIKLDPQDAQAYNNRGYALAHTGVYDKAATDFSQAIQLDKAYAEAYFGRGWIRHAKQQFRDAIGDFTKAIELAPEAFGAAAHFRRALAHYELNEFDKAAADSDQALKLMADDGDVEARSPVLAASALARAGKGEFRAALDACNEAMRVAPDDPAGYGTAAQILAACPVESVRDGQNALEHARKACERSGWDDANWLDALAKAYAETGDFGQATQWQERVVNRLDDFLPFQRNACKERLELYKAGKPYREQRWSSTSNKNGGRAEE
jgi:tetratricopeptide (TPR) repeat protein